MLGCEFEATISLFQAKYIPNRDFLDSSIEHNPSYVWRNIWSLKFVVTNGFKCSIGTDSHSLLGAQMKVWNVGMLQGLVSHLFKKGLVSHDNVRKVLQTPLFDSVQNDKLLWKYEKERNVLRKECT